LTDERSVGELNNDVVVSRRPRLAGTVVFADGMGRSGKGMIGPLISSFDRVELEKVEEIFEFIGTLHRLGKIDPGAAAVALRTQADILLHNGLIGRNSNFRWNDHSSVFRATQRLKHVKRLFTAEGASTAALVRAEHPIVQNMTHDQLSNFGLFHAAFGPDLRIVEMIRHPLGLADSWRRRGWDSRFGTDPLSFTYCIDHHGIELPYYAAGWEEAYAAASPTGRIVRTLARVWAWIMESYEALSDAEKGQVFFISYEEFIRNPTPSLEPLASFLGTNTTKHTKTMMNRLKLPSSRVFDFPKIRDSIYGELTPEERTILGDLIEQFEATKKWVIRG
jgi:hypothetical protein